MPSKRNRRVGHKRWLKQRPKFMRGKLALDRLMDKPMVKTDFGWFSWSEIISPGLKLWFESYFNHDYIS